MLNKIWIPLLFLFSLGCENEKPSNEKDYFDLVRAEFKGDLAYETTAYVSQYWRVAGNTGFNNSVHWIANHLEQAGYVLESVATSKDRLTYRIEKRPLKYPTWEPVNANLSIVGDSVPLLISETNRNMTYLNSASTPSKGVVGDIVHILDTLDLEKKSIKDKIIFTEMSSREVYKKALDKMALGIITYNNPSYLQPEKNKTSIQFRSLPPQVETHFWGIALSYEANERLKANLIKGKTKVQVAVETKIYPSEELTVVANIKGDKIPKERLVFSAHIQEPGANDNATGVGTQLEMATIAANLHKKGEIHMDRTLTFLWGDEIVSTQRYIEEDEERAEKIKWGISLDMVGENTAITGGSFLIEKMPDPSAIWTRGNDKHSEWGGRVLSLKDMKPHYLNDFIIDNFKKQGEFAHWEVNTNPFEGGSDHTPFLRANIPGLLLWHFTDQFYHTDNDKLDKVSKETLKNVGTAALASALQLLNSNESTALQILQKTKESAIERLEEEFNLSKTELDHGASLKEEIKIMKAWEDWYLKGFSSVLDMVGTSKSNFLEKQILNSQDELKKSVTYYISELKAQKKLSKQL
ncbi:hypothetical protein GGR42_002046 [Saonia flava]|uniref:Peptidase M28 domain-containing protein n=1 Tax=Saonia flava TaxID=523696 RepID=A0A846R2I8_9FLAO|nr:M28 family peptidase [Saonia flava]NJB71584.1 hypothetical protein [Saonia flava]